MVGQKPKVVAIAIIAWMTGVILWLSGACWYFGSSEPRPSQLTLESGSGSTPAAEPTSQVSADALGVAPTKTPGGIRAPTGAPGAPASPETVPPEPGQVTVSLAATTAARVRVTVDGTVEFDGTLAAGERQAWKGSERIQVWTDSGRTLLLAVNGQDLGPYSPAMGHPEWNQVDFGFWPGWTR
jgi:uncharacterized protein DUF4115